MTTTPKKLRSRTRNNPRGTLQPTRNDANDGILSYTPLPVSLSSWSSFKLSFAERSNVHGLPFPVPNEPTDFWTLSQQTQSELDPSDGWDDPVDEIHSYVTRGTFLVFKKSRSLPLPMYVFCSNQKRRQGRISTTSERRDRVTSREESNKELLTSSRWS